MSAPPKDPWQNLSAWTPARIALGRSGAALPTREVLDFARAHAQARDAVHAVFDAHRVSDEVRALGHECVCVESQAITRDLYLRRPDRGRLLSAASANVLDACGARPSDIALIIADGLSATAVHAHALPTLKALLPRLAALNVALAPIVVARGARVALGDEVAVRLDARATAILIGERPGLSSPDSLGIYFTYAPQAGRTDADRNCISNIRAEGLGYDLAAFKLSWLIREAFRRGISGVTLKDESDALLLPGTHASLPVLADGRQE